MAENVGNFFGLYEWFPGECGGNQLWATVESFICTHFEVACDLFYKLIGFHADVDNVDRNMKEYVRHDPSGMSLRQIAHYGQLIGGDYRNKNVSYFGKYDYFDDDLNKAAYGQVTPPYYDLTKFSIPTVLITGSVDDLATPTNTKKIIEAIGHNLVESHILKGWTHHTLYIALHPELLFNLIDKALGNK